ncbi:hypothetical protein ACRALDRAFT_205897 [Sodiomyces alcalophilus JCM 7366]|uniref:uncharacterized protein n=1 Tax=Sodiomyces alcalophilus JCM 7366 TaxID=591952 RepID=UPI0039B3E9B5
MSYAVTLECSLGPGLTYSLFIFVLTSGTGGHDREFNPIQPIASLSIPEFAPSAEHSRCKTTNEQSEQTFNVVKPCHDGPSDEAIGQLGSQKGGEKNLINVTTRLTLGTPSYPCQNKGSRILLNLGPGRRVFHRICLPAQIATVLEPAMQIPQQRNNCLGESQSLT